MTFVGLTPEGIDQLETVQDFVTEASMTWPVGYGAMLAMEALQVDALPTIFVVDRTGLIASRLPSVRNLEKAIDRALQGN